MDMTGTSITQSAAAAPVQAQQVARAQDRREADRQRSVRRVRDVFEAHLRSLEESDQEQATPRLHVDDRLPDRSIADELHEQMQRARRKRSTADASPDEGDTPAPESTDSSDSSVSLYRHLDLTA